MTAPEKSSTRQQLYGPTIKNKLKSMLLPKRTFRMFVSMEAYSWMLMKPIIHGEENFTV
jgi:hypothetical protein